MTSKHEDIENIPYLNNFKNQTMRTEEMNYGSVELGGNKYGKTQKIHFRSQEKSKYEKSIGVLGKVVRFLSLHR